MSTAFNLVSVVNTGRTIGLHKRQVTDFWLTQIGERHPVSLSITQCHGNIVTENGLRNLFRSCADSLQVKQMKFVIIFGVEQRIDKSEIRTNDLRINVPALHQLSYLALYWQCPYFVNIFVRGCQSEAIQPLTAV